MNLLQEGIRGFESPSHHNLKDHSERNICNSGKYSQNAGFTLIELSVLLIVAGLLAAAFFTALEVEQKRKVVEKQRKNAIIAINGFRDFISKPNPEYYGQADFNSIINGGLDLPLNPTDAQIQDTIGNRYPCPSDPSIGVGNPDAGQEALHPNAFIDDPADDPVQDPATTNMTIANIDEICDIVGDIRVADGALDDPNDVIIGGMPYKTLGLEPDEGTDAFGNQYTYAITAGATAWNQTASQSAINQVDLTGAPTGDPQQTYVVVSHGDDGRGAYSVYGAGPLGGGTCPAGNAQLENCDDDASFIIEGPSARQTAVGPTYYDDFAFNASSSFLDSEFWDINGTGQIYNINDGENGHVAIGTGPFASDSSDLENGMLNVQGPGSGGNSYIRLLRDTAVDAMTVLNHDNTPPDSDNVSGITFSDFLPADTFLNFEPPAAPMIDTFTMQANGTTVLDGRMSIGDTPVDPPTDILNLQSIAAGGITMQAANDSIIDMTGNGNNWTIIANNNFAIDDGANDNNLFINGANSNVGINENLPGTRLHVDGDLTLEHDGEATATEAIISFGGLGTITHDTGGTMDFEGAERYLFTSTAGAPLDTFEFGNDIGPNELSAHITGGGLRVEDQGGNNIYQMRGNEAALRLSGNSGDQQAFVHVLPTTNSILSINHGPASPPDFRGDYIGGTIIQDRALRIMPNGDVGIQETDAIIAGAPPIVALTVNGDIRADNIETTSDIRLKEDITYLNETFIDKIKSLSPVSYKFKKDDRKKNTTPANDRLGFIAQDVQKIFPIAISGDDESYLSLDYRSLTAPMAASIKELDQTDSRQTALLENVSDQILLKRELTNDLKKEIKALESLIDNYEKSSEDLPVQKANIFLLIPSLLIFLLGYFGGYKRKEIFIMIKNTTKRV